MRSAEPVSRGRMAGRTSADAPAAEAKRLQDAQRVRRYRDRRERGEAVGRFLITERLIDALVASGDLTEREAMSKEGIEQGVTAVLGRFTSDFTQ